MELEKEKEAAIAYCIPTCNHPKVVRDVLRNNSNICRQYNIDIYIYDSSTNEQTYDVIKQFTDQGLDNVYYVRIDSAIGIDEKLLMIFRGFGLKKKYRYLWPVKDRVIVFESLLEVLIKEIAYGYDAIFLDCGEQSENEQNTKQIYHRAEEFYRDEGWIATSMNATVFHYDSLLKNINWDQFKERYFFDNENQFDHFTVLFHSLGMKKNVAVLVLRGENIQFRESGLGKSSWMKSTFKIWGKLWLQVNKALPDCYDPYKDGVIRQAASLPWILGSLDILIILREEGILTSEIYEQMKSVWQYVSVVPQETFRRLAYSKPDEINRIGITFWDIVDYLISTGQYDDMCDVYLRYSWLKAHDKNGSYILLGQCIKIYLIERQAHIEHTIFHGIPNAEHAVEKYRTIKHMLRRLENGIAVETWNEIIEYIICNQISSYFIIFIADLHCLNKILVLEQVNHLYLYGDNNE